MTTANFEEKRKYRRFSDRAFAAMSVNLVPVPPLFGEPTSGTIVDLSAGGMAIVLGELIPRKMMLRMTLSFRDGSKMESVVLVRRASSAGRGGPFMHGMEFLNLSPADIERLEAMAKDCLACDDRVKATAPTVCQSGCRFSGLCMRPQRKGGAQQPVRVEFTNVDDESTLAALRARVDEVTKKGL